MTDNVVVVTPSPLLVTGGVAGPQGPTGPGVPNGGSTGQILAKTSGVDQATAWVTGPPVDSPTFTGDPKAPTPAVADNDTSIATTAFVGSRLTVTHPNTDDVLVRAWDVALARWQVTHYDSGWRTIASENTVWDTATVFRIRRVNERVTISGRFTSTAGGAGWVNNIFTLPTGWRAMDYVPKGSGYVISGGTYYLVLPGTTGALTSLTLASVGASTPGASVAAGASLGFEISFTTNDAIPASLPGTLYSAAPA